MGNLPYYKVITLLALPLMFSISAISGSASKNEEVPISKKWGFFGHKRINRVATFTLPTEMFGFYENTNFYIRCEIKYSLVDYNPIFFCDYNN